jgi:two-component system, sensor histidine kinase
MRSSGRLTSVARPKRRLDLRGVVVLVVEDHDDSREMLRQMVGAFGAAVLTARNGREAIELLSEAVPDLVLLDLVMPGMDGFTFVEHLRERKALARVPVIAVTALGAPLDVMKTWEAGFNGHLVKPVTMDIIEAQLERVFWAHRHTQG